MALLTATAVVQASPGATNRWGLLVAGFSSSLKAVSTPFARHRERLQGPCVHRFDMVYNTMFVAGSALAALVLPHPGLSGHRQSVWPSPTPWWLVFALATEAHGNDVADKAGALGGLPAANPERMTPLSSCTGVAPRL